MNKKILVIAPHPDDEVLGCGGTIAKYSQKRDKVFVCYVTTTYEPEWTKEFAENRKKEIESSNKILGIKKSYFLNYPTVKLDTIPQKELNEAIFKIVNEIKPDIVYIPHKGDLNKDHRLVFESSLVAMRPPTTVKRILSYETLSETEWGNPLEPFNPNSYEDISKTFDKKLLAMKEFVSELKEFPHPRSLEAIESLAKKRGCEVGVNYAESFLLIREIK